MSRLFLTFLLYSFFGYCLEKIFACATHSQRQVRKCFLLLPLCPVYGLAMTAVIALSPAFESFFLLAMAGGAVCTAAEYLVHLFYDRVFQVKFWDYSALGGNVNGRICPQFAVVWGILSALAVRFVHPAAAAFIVSVYPAAVFFLWIIFSADCVLTSGLLSEYHDTELLSLTALLSIGSPANPEHRDRRTDESSH